MRTTPLSVRASPTPVVARAESSTETQQDGQKREHSGLRLIGIQQEKLKLRRTAMPLLGGYFPTKKILKALKVCLRGLLMGIAENLIGIWRAKPRFSTSLSRCHGRKTHLKEKQERIRFVSQCVWQMLLQPPFTTSPIPHHQ